jgi:hypothetical protein
MNVQVAARLTRERIERNALTGSWPAEGPCGYVHVHSMLVQIEDGGIAGEKAHRWLGWAQCAAVAAGASVLDEMKAINYAA